MPVRDLAPALLALGNLFTEASDALYPEREPVALGLVATDIGSFEAHLILEAKNAWDQVRAELCCRACRRRQAARVHGQHRDHALAVSTCQTSGRSVATSTAAWIL